MENTDTFASDNKGNRLIRIGGISALLCALMYIIALGIYIPANIASPPPSNVTEWFTLFQSDPLVGLFYLGLADIVIMILWIPMVLALYTLLKQGDKAWLTLAVILVIVGVAVYIATNAAFSVLSLSQKFAEATSEADRATIMAAGQSFIALTDGTGARYLGMPLVWFSGIIISVIMLQSKIFRRPTAWFGILGLGFLILSVPFAGYTTTGSSTNIIMAIIFVTYTGGGILSLIWYIMIGTKLLKTQDQPMAGGE